MRPPRRLRAPLQRLGAVPFESLIAWLVILSGVAGLLEIGDISVLDALLPRWVYIALNISYSLSGLLMFVGLGLGRGNVEAAGLVLLLSAVLVRFVGVGLAVGFLDERVLLLLALYVMTFVASLVRLRTITRGERLAVLGEEHRGDP